MNGPSPLNKHPMEGFPQVCFIKNTVETIATLEAIAWWDWPIDKITSNLAVIVSADIEALKRCAE